MRRPRGRELTISLPKELHPATQALVKGFAEAMAAKLREAEQKYGYRNGWRTQDWETECRQHMHDHIAKGDPRDVAIYCAFMWCRGWCTAADRVEQEQAP